MFERKCLEMENGVSSGFVFKGWFYSKSRKTPAGKQLFPPAQCANFRVLVRVALIFPLK